MRIIQLRGFFFRFLDLYFFPIQNSCSSRTICSSTMLMQGFRSNIQIFIIGNYHSPITASAKILRRIKGKTANISHCTCHSSPICASNRLGIILNHLEVMPSSNIINGIHVTYCTKNLNRDNCSCLIGYGGFNTCRINRIVIPANINKNWCCPRLTYGFRCREKGERSSNHLIAISYPTSAQCDDESIRAGINPNSIFNA